MLIGQTSALTMNIAGVIKDWILVFCSYYVFKAPLTFTNLFGYVFCCRWAGDLGGRLVQNGDVAEELCQPTGYTFGASVTWDNAIAIAVLYTEVQLVMLAIWHKHLFCA